MKPTKGEWETIVFQGKSSILPGKVVPLVNFALTTEDDENLLIISKFLDETTIHIVYECLYGERVTYSQSLHIA